MEGRQGKKDTGRPRNEFAWSHVTMIEGSSKWKCNYCPKEYAGSASRIVNHLSGQGGGISRCQGVPLEIRQEALKYKSNKTRVGEDGNAAAATNMNNTDMVNEEREEMDVDPLPNNNNAVSVELTYYNNNSNPNDQSIREERDTRIGHSSLAIPAAAAASPSDINVLNQTTAAPVVEPAVLSTDAQPGVQNNPVVATPNSNLNGYKTLAEIRSLLSLSNSVGVREDDNAAAANMINEEREEEAAISKYPKNTYRFGDGEAAPALTDSSVALSRDYLISKSAPTGWNESTHEEPAVSSGDAADGRSAEFRRIATATDSILGIPPPPTTTTTDNIVHGFINPRAELAPTGSTLPRINEEAIDSPDQPDHNPVDATPEDMEEDNMSGRGRAFPQPAQYEEPAVTSRAPRRSTKRVRVSSSVSSANIDASSNLPLSIATRSSGHERVKDVFVKFQMCSNNVSPMPSDFARDPLFREFVESVGKHGVPSNLLGVDSSDALQESVLRIKHEVERNMLMLKESWKTTDCTLMVFDLNKHYTKGELDPFRSMEDKIVIAIYCPKGIIFVEAPPKADDDDYMKALARHSPSLYTDELVHWLRHDPYDHDNYKICELNYIPQDYYWDGYAANHSCLRSEIKKLCSRSYLDSEWAGSLVDVAVRIHERLCFLGDPWYYSNISTEKDFNLDVSLFKKEASRLPIFLLIMRHDPERESSPGHRMKQPDIEAITTKGSKFWSDGRQLALILKCVLKFVEVMDTLVPTSGYFDMAFDKVKNIIESCRLQLGEDALQFWEELKSEIEHIANTKFFDENSCSRLACSYLNPAYFVQQLQKHPLLPAYKLKKALEEIAEIRRLDQDKIDEEVERYGKVFSKLSKSIQLERLHPVKLWEEYGHDLPVLRRFALEWLSRPLSCPCKQVKEHLYQLKGADDYILRLNFRMMRHFQRLGDDIYEPLDLSVLAVWNFTLYIPRSVQNWKFLLFTYPDDHGGSSSGDLDDHGGLKNAQSRVIDPPVSSNAHISFPYIDVIPMSMRTHLIGYRDVDRDGNCGYRAIAEGLGLGQHQWPAIRKSMINTLNEYQSLLQKTFHFHTIDEMLVALDYFGQDFAPKDKWLSLPDMGCLVATTFNCAFVVLGGENQTYLPMYLPEDQTNNLNIKTVCICLLTEDRHFISVSLSENSPLPPLYHMWPRHHHESAGILINHFGSRLMEERTASNVNRDHESLINFFS